MPDLEPITRDEMLWSGEDVEPITRREMYIRHLYDETQVIPDKPITREEMFILKAGEELHDVTIEQLNVTENGTYSEAGKAYSPVIVEVPETTLTTLDVTENGTYTAPSGTAYDEVDVNVPLPPNAYLLKEIEDVAIASFNDGADLPMPKLEVAIEPQQEGSGEPSPTNIRPISGWDECNVGVVGKNLCKSTIHGYVSSTDNLIIIDNDTESAIFYAFEGKTYTISSSATMNKSRLALVGTDIVENYTPILQREILADNVNTWTATWTGWTVWYKCSSKQTAFDNSAQVELGSTATTYEPYNGQTYTIDFVDGSSPLTVYGGTLDVLSGLLTVDKVSVDLGTLNYSAYGGTSSYDRYISSSIDSVAKADGLCVSDIYTFKGTQTMSANQIWVGGGNSKLSITTDVGVYNDASAFKTAMSGHQLVYELATPQTIQLTPTQVKSLLGSNNVWGDCGQIKEGSYFAKSEEE